MIAKNESTTPDVSNVMGYSGDSEFSKGQTEVIVKAVRPKLLFLAYHFPPTQAIASVRTWNIAKYLARLGWDVTVVTPEPALCRHLEEPEGTSADFATEGIHRILTGHNWRFLDPDQLTSSNKGLRWLLGGTCRRIAGIVGVDRGVGWIRAAEKACLRIGSQDVDLILASGPPFSAFMLAERLSRKLARPYALDYRDPWTKVPGTAQVFQPLVVRLERRLLSGCAAVTTVSHSWAANLRLRFNVGLKLHVVTNGYDPQELGAVEPQDFGHFAIVYAGIFYPSERVITPILSALKRLKLSGKSGWYFHYYGDHDRHVLEEAVKLGVADHVRLHGRVRRAQALSAIRGANIAVVINSVLQEATVKSKGWVPAKLFEMIGLGTPILLISPSGCDVESIVEPTGLARRFTGDDIDGIAGFIEEAISGWKVMKSNAESFKWNYLAKTFDRVLREILRS